MGILILDKGKTEGIRDDDDKLCYMRFVKCILTVRSDRMRTAGKWGTACLQYILPYVQSEETKTGAWAPVFLWLGCWM